MALRLALDSNRYSAYAKGDTDTQKILESAESIAFPFVVVGELRSGFRAGIHSLQNEKRLVEFMQLHFVSVLYPDNDTTHLYAMIYSELQQQGKPIPTNDMWIAALVMQHGLTLHSRDRHFERIAIPMVM